MESAALAWQLSQLDLIWSVQVLQDNADAALAASSLDVTASSLESVMRTLAAGGLVVCNARTAELERELKVLRGEREEAAGLALATAATVKAAAERVATDVGLAAVEFVDAVRQLEDFAAEEQRGVNGRVLQLEGEVGVTP
jgi:hypothetical protein